eukprot:6832795-Lingulodinium_polyedra.AAC.1
MVPLSASWRSRLFRLRNDAFKRGVRRFSPAHWSRARTPCARRERRERPNVRFWNGAAPTRVHHFVLE